MNNPSRRGYSKAIQREHAAICDAIVAGDVEAAREAMRQHLGNSQARYRLLAAEAAAAQGTTALPPNAGIQSS